MQSEEVLAHNVTVLAAALRAAKAKSATACYSGSGDSGDMYEITIDGPKGAKPGQVTYLEPAPYNYSNPDPDPKPTEQTADFNSALEDLLWLAVSDSGHDGWENNDGGGGTFTLFADGHATLDHYDNVVEEQHSDYEFTGSPLESDQGEEE